LARESSGDAEREGRGSMARWRTVGELRDEAASERGRTRMRVEMEMRWRRMVLAECAERGENVFDDVRGSTGLGCSELVCVAVCRVNG
jgi:hypothetical protein